MLSSNKKNNEDVPHHTSKDHGAAQPEEKESRNVSTAPADQTQTETLDGFLVLALRNHNDRDLILKLEQDMEYFILDQRRYRLAFPRMNSYHRLVIHRVAQYYNLAHVVNSNKNIVILYRTEHTLIPNLKLSDLIDLSYDDAASSTGESSRQSRSMAVAKSQSGMYGGDIPFMYPYNTMYAYAPAYQYTPDYLHTPYNQYSVQPQDTPGRLVSSEGKSSRSQNSPIQSGQQTLGVGFLPNPAAAYQQEPDIALISNQFAAMHVAMPYTGLLYDYSALASYDGVKIDKNMDVKVTHILLIKQQQCSQSLDSRLKEIGQDTQVIFRLRQSKKGNNLLVFQSTIEADHFLQQCKQHDLKQVTRWNPLIDLEMSVPPVQHQRPKGSRHQSQ
ncbi:hypothetical protein MIR68_008987 [Amoeboaphelidium protococcarum]|nr:hypothetical protein MIR68_008987 [Amoeboaphelidium protococcarum]